MVSVHTSSPPTVHPVSLWQDRVWVWILETQVGASLVWKSTWKEKEDTVDWRSRKPSILNAKYNLNYYQKLLEIEKGIVREVARGDKPYLRKSTDRKAQISLLNWMNAFLICALRSVDFLR